MKTYEHFLHEDDTAARGLLSSVFFPHEPSDEMPVADGRVSCARQRLGQALRFSPLIFSASDAKKENVVVKITRPAARRSPPPGCRRQ